MTKKAIEANNLLAEGKITVAAWQEVYVEYRKLAKMVDDLEAPKNPDNRDWYMAKLAALEELGREAGLLMRDGL